MKLNQKEISASKCAALCGVCRATVNNWIGTKKLHAKRTGNKYSIPVDELMIFLKTTKRDIPDELKWDDFEGPILRSPQYCWEYWEGGDHAKACKDCVVFINNLDVCFIAKESCRLQCKTKCSGCKYYLEIYLPRINFVHQVDVPTAIARDLYLWGGNKAWADLFNVDIKDLPGMGIEQLIHSDSLQMVITNIKKRALGIPGAPRFYSVFITNKDQGKIRADVTVYPLKEPANANVVFLEPSRDNPHA